MGGDEAAPTESGEIPMVSELEGGVNRSATTPETAENGRPRADGRKTHENGFQTAPPGPRVRGAPGRPPHPFSAKVGMERENPIFGPLVAP